MTISWAIVNGMKFESSRKTGQEAYYDLREKLLSRKSHTAFTNWTKGGSIIIEEEQDDSELEQMFGDLFQINHQVSY